MSTVKSKRKPSDEPRRPAEVEGAEPAPQPAAQPVPAAEAPQALIARQPMGRDQVELIRRTICNGATDDEMQLFLMQCQRTGLDPFSRQIHAVRRQGKMVIQVGIDGYRLIADRTGRYAGNDDPVFDDEAQPGKATVTVWKVVGGVRCPFTASARWSQYYPGDGAPGFMWRRMPHLMLGKVAEALALRKAFPAELSGLYSRDEFPEEHAEEPQPTPAVVNEAIARQEAKQAAPPPDRAAWLHGRDAELAHEGLLGKAGDLVEHVRSAVDGSGDDGRDETKWDDSAWKVAMSAGKEYVHALLVDEVARLLDAKGKRAEDALTFLNVKAGTSLAMLDNAQLRRLIERMRPLQDAPANGRKAS